MPCEYGVTYEGFLENRSGNALTTWMTYMTSKKQVKETNAKHRFRMTIQDGALYFYDEDGEPCSLWSVHTGERPNTFGLYLTTAAKKDFDIQELFVGHGDGVELVYMHGEYEGEVHSGGTPNRSKYSVFGLPKDYDLSKDLETYEATGTQAKRERKPRSRKKAAK
jgi:hypothetical protein